MFPSEICTIYLRTFPFKGIRRFKAETFYLTNCLLLKGMIMSSYMCGSCGTEVRGYDGCPTCKMIAAQERMARAAEDQARNLNSQNTQIEYVYLDKSSVTAIKIVSVIILLLCFIPFADGIQTSGFGAVIQLLAALIGLQCIVTLIK
jgi:hypothetical protein